MRRTATALALLTASATAAQAAPPREAAPPVQALQGAVDDSDLNEEPTLGDLIKEDTDKDSWSMGTAIGLSFIPGGGLGLFYAEKPAAGWVTISLAAVGYGLGAAYMLGAFDKSTKTVCRYQDAVAKPEECDYAQGGLLDNQHPKDPRTGKYYFEESNDFSTVTTGNKFDGKQTGLIIMAATYGATTLLGAIWSGSAVYKHNDDARKKAESTASLPHPILGVAPGGGFFGLGMDF
jgi:hypothetical protein